MKMKLKLIIIFFILFILALGIRTFATEYKFGDVDLNGKINTTDYLSIKYFFCGRDIINNEVSKYLADINQDGKINTADYLTVKYCLMNKSQIKTVNVVTKEKVKDWGNIEAPASATSTNRKISSYEIKLNGENLKWKRVNFCKGMKDGELVYQMVRVHPYAEENFKIASLNIEKLFLTGILQENDIQGLIGTVTVRHVTGTRNISNHSLGVAMDINTDYTTKDNTKPYSGMGKSTLNNYIKTFGLKYVENSDGTISINEEYYASSNYSNTNNKNVNYILWKYAFKPAGFDWSGERGGNLKISDFDPMHFAVLKDGEKNCTVPLCNIKGCNYCGGPENYFNNRPDQNNK